MIEVKVKGDWPETGIKDIYDAWNKINEFNLDSPKILLVGPKHLLNSLDAQYGETILTYMSVLKENKLIDDDIRLNTDNKFAVLHAYTINHDQFPKIVFDVETIKITGIRSIRNRSTRPVTCSKCGHETEMPEAKRDGDYYKWYSCTCGHRTEIKGSKEK